MPPDYIGALLWCGIFACLKRIKVNLDGNTGRNHKKFQLRPAPNQCVAVQQLFFAQSLSTVGEDLYWVQKQLNEAGRWAHSGEYVLASGAGSVKSEH